MPRSAQPVPESQFIGWLWKAAGAKGRKAPGAIARIEAADWEVLDEARPLIVPWAHVLLTCMACEVKTALWLSDRKSPVVDVMDSIEKHGVAVISEVHEPGPKGLLLLYMSSDENDVDVLGLSAEDAPCLVHPGWGVACERVYQGNAG